MRRSGVVYSSVPNETMYLGMDTPMRLRLVGLSPFFMEFLLLILTCVKALISRYVIMERTKVVYEHEFERAIYQAVPNPSLGNRCLYADIIFYRISANEMDEQRIGDRSHKTTITGNAARTNA